MSMHFLPASHIATPVNWTAVHRGRRETLLLAGFSDTDALAISARLRGAGMGSVATCNVAEALGHLLDDPGDYCGCILDARAFADDEALSDVLRLLSIEPGGFRVIVANHPAPERLTMTDRHRSTLDAAMGALEAGEEIAALARLCCVPRHADPRHA